MWKHSSKSRTEKYNDYGTRNRKQRNTRNETTHLRHQRSEQTPSGDCPNASPAVRGRNLPHGARGLRTAFHQSSHLAGLSGQGHYPLHPNRRENTLSPLRHQQTASRKLSLHQLYKKIGENLISIYFYLFSQFLERVFIFTISDP